MIIRSLAASALVLCLAACAGAPRPAASSGPPRTLGDGDLLLGEVAPRKLGDDQCTLILMSRGDPQMRVAVATDRPAQASLNVGGEEIVLARTAQTGAALLGHAESQSWTGPDGVRLTADVRFDRSSGDPRGAAIRSASISFTNAAGATLAAPVVGLLACGPDAAP